MKGRVKLAAGVGVIAAVTVAATMAVAGGGESIREELSGYEEDPLVRSTPGNGSFKARISDQREEIDYRLSYADLESDVTQAHIHFGGPRQSGGISVYLCTNLGNGPAGTQACPPDGGTVSGTIRPADVVGPTDQGIAVGEFGELIDAIRHGVTYVNVHTVVLTGGEIRAQLEGDHDD
jgi:CHRD domain